jgi:hypothetical protein
VAFAPDSGVLASSSGKDEGMGNLDEVSKKTSQLKDLDGSGTT